jgi:hypothetical protein
VIGPAALLAAAWAAMWNLAPWSDTRITDVFVYAHDAAQLAGGATPYSGAFPLEYPPLALVPMWLARQLGGADGFETAFGLLMGLCALACLVAVGRLGGRRAAWAFALTPLLAGAVLRTHFDLFAVAVLLAALVALQARRTTLAFALLGVATMVKLFPVVLVAVLACWLWGRGERRGALRGVLVSAGVILAVSAPFLGQGYVDAYRYHLDRPVQIESTPASVLWPIAGSHVTGTTTTPDAFGSNGLVGGGADAVQALFAVLALAALAAAALLAARRPDERQLLLCGAAAVVAFVALGKVFSPQYVAWLAPFAALLLAGGERLAAALIAVGIALTTVEFPRLYVDLVGGDTAVAILVGARNVVLLAALAVLIARAAGAARSPRHAAGPPRSAPARP